MVHKQKRSLKVIHNPAVFSVGPLESEPEMRFSWKLFFAEGALSAADDKGKQGAARGESKGQALAWSLDSYEYFQ